MHLIITRDGAPSACSCRPQLPPPAHRKGASSPSLPFNTPLHRPFCICPSSMAAAPPAPDAAAHSAAVAALIVRRATKHHRFAL